jgi:hypothetical protein
LSGEDEAYLIRQGFRHEASRLRTDHRQLFFGFVSMLEREFGVAHAARKQAMVDNWDFETLMKERLAASYYLWVLRAAGCMHFMNLPKASRLAEAYFERVRPMVVLPKFASQAISA